MQKRYRKKSDGIDCIRKAYDGNRNGMWKCSVQGRLCRLSDWIQRRAGNCFGYLQRKRLPALYWWAVCCFIHGEAGELYADLFQTGIYTFPQIVWADGYQ